MTTISAERRKELAGRLVTLDGELGVITGRLNRFATIGQVKRGNTVEFCWETVDHIVMMADANKEVPRFYDALPRHADVTVAWIADPEVSGLQGTIVLNGDAIQEGLF
jgi:hypothetical protein